MTNVVDGGNGEDAVTVKNFHLPTILKTRLKSATDILSARREAKKGKRVAMKDQLLLPTEETYKTVAALDKEAKIVKEKKKKKKKKERERAGGARKPKPRQQESESESDD